MSRANSSRCSSSRRSSDLIAGRTYRKQNVIMKGCANAQPFSYCFRIQNSLSLNRSRSPYSPGRSGSLIADIGKSVADPVDLISRIRLFARLVRPALHPDLDDVKADARTVGIDPFTVHVIIGAAADPPLFGRTYSFSSCSALSILPPGLDLDKEKRSSLPSDQVDLRLRMRTPCAARYPAAIFSISLPVLRVFFPGTPSCSPSIPVRSV